MNNQQRNVKKKQLKHSQRSRAWAHLLMMKNYICFNVSLMKLWLKASFYLFLCFRLASEVADRNRRLHEHLTSFYFTVLRQSLFNAYRGFVIRFITIKCEPRVYVIYVSMSNDGRFSLLHFRLLNDHAKR